MKKLLLSILAIFLVIGLVGAGTLAWFQDTETSTGNTFTAGTMDLKIWTGSTWGDVGETAIWTMSKMEPGITTDSGKAEVKWLGSITPHHMEITCSYTATEGPPTGDMDNVDQDDPASWDGFAKYVEITAMSYYNGHWSITWDSNGNYTTSAPPDANEPSKPIGWSAGDWQLNPDTDEVAGISLCDLKNDPLTNLPPGAQNEVIHFEMTVRFSSLAGNDLQGDTLNVTMIFTVRQS